jgi:hypothetical protein
VRRAAALLVAALALSGCETSAEKSAKLEKAAKRRAAAEGPTAQTAAPTVASTFVKVVSVTLVHGSEGAAAAVTLRNDSPRAQQRVPVEITLRDPHGHVVFSNFAAGGTEAALTSVPSIPARGELTWVDDQLPAKSAASTLSTLVGEGQPVSANLPPLSVSGVHAAEEASGPGAAGTVENHSKTAQLHLVVFAVARRGSQVVAAGRAVLPEVAARSSAPFKLFLIGNAQGAQLEASAPAVTFG